MRTYVFWNRNGDCTIPPHIIKSLAFVGRFDQFFPHNENYTKETRDDMARTGLGRWPGKNFVMNNELKSVFDGAILSDGSFIQQSKISAYFSMSLSVENKDWILNISEIFDKNDVEHKICYYPGKNRISKGKIIHEGPSVRISTPSYRNLLSERERWYPNGIKIVPKDIVLNNVVLAGWYMGDGSISITRRHNTRVCLHVQCFSYNDVSFLSKELLKLDLSSKILKIRESQFILSMTRTNAEKFVDLVRNYTTPSFSYKLNTDKWEPPICTKCGMIIDDTNNFKKYCSLCIPRCVEILRKSRSKNNRINNELRNAKRAVKRGTATEIEKNIVAEHELMLIKRGSEAVQKRKVRQTNAKIMHEKLKSHKWPTRHRMEELIELTSLSEISKLIGVSVNCVSLKCKQLKLKAKPPEYWTWRKDRLSYKELSI
jgi:hypothetical protein